MSFLCPHLVVLLENVVHLSHVLAAYGLDDVPLVVGGVEASTTTTLSFTDEGRSTGQRVLPTHIEKRKMSWHTQ